MGTEPLTLLRHRRDCDRARQCVAKNQDAFRTHLEIDGTGLFIAAVLCGTLIWVADGDVVFVSSAPSAFERLWFGVVALTTTGAELNAPATLFRRIVASTTMTVARALFGVLISIIGRAMLKSLFEDGVGEAGDIGTLNDNDGNKAHAVRGSVSKAVNQETTLPRRLNGIKVLGGEC